ncbi:hypothetical protein D9738_03195 [Escherichia sp. E10V5]|nr:hypothetical protein D9734_05935 [Escherichia sp. E14S1]RZN43200.1 hypothetical protein D9738_03195 [Escherichia sp. E10V5]TBR69103.1 hypothetical protein D9737_06400 [Escherichia sp. E10V4]
MRYTRHTSSCMCCDCVHSPQSLTSVSSRGFTHLSRYSALGLALSGPTQALFKTPLAFCPAS